MHTNGSNGSNGSNGFHQLSLFGEQIEQQEEQPRYENEDDLVKQAIENIKEFKIPNEIISIETRYKRARVCAEALLRYSEYLVTTANIAPYEMKFLISGIMSEWDCRCLEQKKDTRV